MTCRSAGTFETWAYKEALRGMFWCVICMHRRFSDTITQSSNQCQLWREGWKVSVSCESMMSVNDRGSPSPKTHQHPHNVRPQLGKTVGHSSAVCLGLIRRRTGPLITFHNVWIFCVQSDKSAANVESKPTGRGLLTSNKRDVGAKAVPRESCPWRTGEMLQHRLARSEV